MVRASTKKTLLGGLVAAFVVQTGLVYTDDDSGELSEAALRGRATWHANSCQVCHQVYGQGGFLGPDLTNAASRVEEARLRSLLSVGSGQMPAFGFAPEEIADIAAYLEALDRPDLGRGQLRLGMVAPGVGPWGPFEAGLEDALEDAPEDVGAGYRAFKARPCSGCHFPLRDSPVGAPDLSLVTGRLTSEELRTVLREGRLERGMPPPTPAFEEQELSQVLAFFDWLGAERDDLAQRLARAGCERTLDWSRLPWWEFK